MNLIKKTILFLPFILFIVILHGETIIGQDHESRDLREVQELSGGPDRTKYQITARAFPEKRELEGVEIIRWTNRSTADISSLRLNLFYNAFGDKGSTFFSETSLYKLTEKRLKKYNFGSIDIKKIGIINRNENISGDLTYLNPDDGNSKDRTCADFTLKKPVLPGQTIWIKIEFKLKIPDIFYKTGQSGKYLFMAHWYPRVCVLKDTGEWTGHQFHRMHGFYSEFNDYHVRITIPGNFKVGATGNRISEDKINESMKTVEFSQENVQNFVWTAYPDFIEIKEKIRLKGNDFDTDIILLLSHRNRSAKERYLNAVKFTLKYFEENLASYPFRTLTVVDPPLQGFNSAGHEYPTLITAAYLKILPASLKYTELAVIHGIAHQFWYGIAGSDGYAEPWLDEGISVFYEMDIMDKYFENKGSLLNSLYIRIFDWEIKRRSYITLSPLERSKYLNWNFINNKFFVGNVYSKLSLLFRSLKNVIGEEELEGFFRYYYDKVKFGHHNTEKLKEEFSNYFNRDYSWAFDQFVGTDKNLDTAVYSVKADKIGESGKYRNEVVFVRNSGYFPVELSLKLKGGKEKKLFWEKNEKWKKVIFTDDNPVDFAFVDPDFKIPLDINLVNNSKAVRKDNTVLRKLTVKFGFYFQNILASLIL
ncbi:MAG: M1 family metallopeptidase [Acidobacteriota bacterium]